MPDPTLRRSRRSGCTRILRGSSHGAASGADGSDESLGDKGRFGRIVWGLARRMSPTAADAEDAVQDVFLDLWAHGDRFDPSRASPELFVAVIARRRLLDRRRKAERRPATTPLDDGGGPAPEAMAHGGGVETAAEASIAARAMAELRPEQREVLRLALAEGLTHDEIARRTGWPLGTVKAHARRGLLRIRQRLLGESVKDGVEEDAR